MYQALDKCHKAQLAISPATQSWGLIIVRSRWQCLCYDAKGGIVHRQAGAPVLCSQPQ